MNKKFLVAKASFLFVSVFLIADNSFACMCGHTSVCDAYSQASAVVVGKVKSFRSPALNESGVVIGQQTVLIQIQKSFKGVKRKLSKLSQEQSTCDWWFDYKNLGRSYLFYLSKLRGQNAYSVISCGRSAEIQKASDDLSWLNGLPRSLRRTRISGIAHRDNDQFDPLTGVRFEVVGEKRTYKLTSDENGLYEIWDVSHGEYSVFPEIPNKYELGWTASVPNNWIYFWSFGDQDKNALKISIAPKNCGGVDFKFRLKKDEKQ